MQYKYLANESPSVLTLIAGSLVLQPRGTEGADRRVPVDVARRKDVLRFQSRGLLSVLTEEAYAERIESAKEAAEMQKTLAQKKFEEMKAKKKAAADEKAAKAKNKKEEAAAKKAEEEAAAKKAEEEAAAKKAEEEAAAKKAEEEGEEKAPKKTSRRRRSSSKK